MSGKTMYRLMTLLVLFAMLLVACTPGAMPAPAASDAAATAAPAAEDQTAQGVAPAATGDAPLNIYVVQHALCAWDSWWCTLADAVAQAESDFNVTVTVLGPDKFDLEKVAQLIDQAVAAQPDALAITVTDPDLFRDPINRAIAAGIPVVAFNAGAGPDEDNIPYLTYIGQDEFQGGYLGGKRLAEAGGAAGVCINHQVGGTNQDKRCAGFLQAMDEAGIPAEVLGISDDPASSQTTISDYFAANPDVDIVMTLGPNGANPFYAFLEESGLDTIKHGTFDTSPEINAAIEDGRTIFGIDQQPYLQGYGAVGALSLAVRYGILPALPVSATGPGFVTKENLGFTPDPARPVKIVAVQHALCAWDAFWCVVEKGLTDAAAARGADIQILGPDKFDLEKVAQLIDQAVAAQPDALAVTVTDADLFREPIQRALDAGIPVVAYNAGAGPDVDDIGYMTYLGQDEFQGGYLGGKRLAEAGGAAGVCINHQVGGTNQDKRCAGFLQAMDEAGIPAEVLGISDDPASSQTTISDYFAANPDTDIAMTLGPNGAIPFYGFLAESGSSAGAIKHGTFDLGAEIVAAIKDGRTMFAIDQQPYLQGYGAVQALVLNVRQGITPALPVTATGPGFVDAKTVDLVSSLSGTFR
jgi:simple sugar transport system substrate-binding protein